MPNNTITFTIEGPSVSAESYAELAVIAARAWGCPMVDQVHLDVNASYSEKLDENSNQWKTVVVMSRRAMSHTQAPVGACPDDE